MNSYPGLGDKDYLKVYGSVSTNGSYLRRSRDYYNLRFTEINGAYFYVGETGTSIGVIKPDGNPGSSKNFSYAIRNLFSDGTYLYVMTDTTTTLTSSSISYIYKCSVTISNSNVTITVPNTYITLNDCYNLIGVIPRGTNQLTYFYGASQSASSATLGWTNDGFSSHSSASTTTSSITCTSAGMYSIKVNNTWFLSIVSSSGVKFGYLTSDGTNFTVINTYTNYTLGNLYYYGDNVYLLTGSKSSSNTYLSGVYVIVVNSTLKTVIKNHTIMAPSTTSYLSSACMYNNKVISFCRGNDNSIIVTIKEITSANSISDIAYLNISNGTYFRNNSDYSYPATHCIPHIINFENFILYKLNSFYVPSSTSNTRNSSAYILFEINTLNWQFITNFVSSEVWSDTLPTILRAGQKLLYLGTANASALGTNGTTQTKNEDNIVFDLSKLSIVKPGHYIKVS